MKIETVEINMTGGTEVQRDELTNKIDHFLQLMGYEVDKPWAPVDEQRLEVIFTDENQ